VRSNILDRYRSSPVRVYVVWFDMMVGDSRDFVDRRVLNDARVTNYYDPKKVVGSWFVEQNGDGGGIVWDAYFLYGPDATWATELGPLVSTGGPVIGASSDLAAAFRNLQ
jgi:hypothetical protein